jgi:hypothetical protein
MEEGIAKIEELRFELDAAKMQACNALTALTDLQSQIEPI